MFRPAKLTESETLVGYLEQQLTAIRAAAYGLSDEQARETPCRSSLSVGGIIKHATYVMGGRAKIDSGRVLAQSAIEQFKDSFALRADETLAGALQEFDRARDSYLQDVRSTDPAADMIAPPAPWDGLMSPTPSVERFSLVHHIEEFARHAGHADIIREQIDGADAGSLLMAVEGRPGNDFIQPWTPALQHSR